MLKHILFGGLAVIAVACVFSFAPVALPIKAAAAVVLVLIALVIGLLIAQRDRNEARRGGSRCPVCGDWTQYYGSCPTCNPPALVRADMRKYRK